MRKQVSLLPASYAAAMLALVLAVPQVAAWIPNEFEPHLPILVLGDSHLALPALISGVRSGSGTAEDPFVISGWDIVPVVGAAITIEGTSAHVVVERNLLHDGRNVPLVCENLSTVQPFCVPPSACSAPTLEDALVGCNQFARSGIAVRNATNVRIVDNALSANPIGVIVQGSNRVEVSGNTVTSDRGASGLAVTDGLFQELESVPKQLVGATPYRLSYPPSVGIMVLESSEVILSQNAVHGFAGSYPPLPESNAALFVRGSAVEAYENEFTSSERLIEASDSNLVLRSNAFNDGTVSLRRANSVARENTLATVVFYACGPGTQLVFQENSLVNSAFFSSADAPDCGGGGMSPVVIGNSFADNSRILMYSDGTIVDNSFTNTTSALIVQRHAPSIERNLFSDADIAIRLYNTTSPVENNTIVNNGYGVVVHGQNKPKLRFNSMTNHAEYALFNTDDETFSASSPPGAIPVDARWNWWGTSEGPNSGINNRTFGAVTASPWLASPP